MLGSAESGLTADDPRGDLIFLLGSSRAPATNVDSGGGALQLLLVPFVVLKLLTY